MNEFLKDAILYEIYPTSFYDGNGDGIGDFAGITEKLDYVKDLGANIIWLNAFYLSPFMDGGYDVADYKKIDPRFGNMRDFEKFIKKAKSLGIKVLVELVIGHTSVKHKWFKASAKKERNKYSDFYMWTDDCFSSYNGKTIMGLYEREGGYYVNYYACQPKLNYGWLDAGKDNCKWKMHYTDPRLKPVRDAMIDVMLFWLDKGVDGFRVDLASSVVRGEGIDFDSEDDYSLSGNKFVWNYLMDGVKAKYPNCIFLSEWVCPPASVGKCGFDFDYIGHDCAPYNELFRNEPKTNLFSDLEKGNNYFSPNGKGSIKPFIDYAKGIFPKIEGKGYFSAPTGCHDEIRIATGIKDDEVLKTAFAFLFTFKNIPFIYYGDEIGLKHNFCVSKDGGGIRTGARTPMQWNENKNRGFSSADITYLPTNNDASCSVASQLQDEFSVLNTVKKLSAIRKEYSFLNADADIEFIEYDYPLIFRRKDKNGSAVIIINPSNRVFERTFNVQKTLLSNNVSVIGNNIKMKEKSFIIFEE